MTKIKICGLKRPCDVEAVNELKPDFAGFVFAPGSSRFVTVNEAEELKERLSADIQAVGVFVQETPENVAALLNQGVIDIAQLHGREDEKYIAKLRRLTDKPIIKAFRMESGEDVREAESSEADYVLLDSGNGGSGETFDWSLAEKVKRDYFLAGGLDAYNVRAAVVKNRPYAVDVSSGVETDGYKDREKMAAFLAEVRKEG